MAKFNEILVGRFNKALQKLTGMKGPAPAPQMATEIMPVIEIFHGVEDRALEDWYRFGFTFETAAIAGQQNAIRFRNQTTDRMVVFEKILVMNRSAAVAEYVLEQGTSALDLGSILILNANLSWDKRRNIGSTLVSSNGLATALPLIRADVIIPGLGGNWDFITSINQEVILSPGEAIQIRFIQLATALVTTWWWRERPMEPSELVS